MVTKYDAVIIGGGIMGLSTAYYLTRAGKKTLLVEKGELGSGASSSCDDMIFLQSKKPGPLLTLAMESLELYRGLAQELPVDIDLETRGGMVFIEDQNQLSVMEGFVRQQQNLGLDVRILEKQEMYEYQPFVSRHVLASTYSPLDSQVNPLKVMRGFAGAAKEKGLLIKRNFDVSEISWLGPYSWLLKSAAGDTIQAEHVINAAGAWSGEISKLIGLKVPVRPKKGQIAVTEQIPALGKTNIWSADYIVMKLNPELAKGRKSILNELGIGLAMSQTSDGNYFIGGTREYTGYDTSTQIRALNLMLQEALRFFPILKNVHIIRTFAGLRPASDDGRPFIGPVDTFPGFYLASGHEGDGIALAPITGKLLEQMISGKETPRILSELNPLRLHNMVKVVDNQEHTGQI